MTDGEYFHLIERHFAIELGKQKIGKWDQEIGNQDGDLLDQNRKERDGKYCEGNAQNLSRRRLGHNVTVANGGRHRTHE